MATAAKERGIAAYRAGNWEVAAREFGEAIARASNDDEELHVYHSNRSAALQQLKRWSLALEDAEAVTALKPGWAKGWVRLATCLDALGRDSSAAWEKAAELDPNSARRPRRQQGSTLQDYWLQAQTWFLGLDQQHRFALAAGAIAILFWALFRGGSSHRYGGYPRRGYGGYSNYGSYGGYSGGGLGMTGLAAIMFAAYKIPPMFGHPPFFGLSPWTLFWLVQSLTRSSGLGGGGYRRSPFGGGFGGGFGGRRRRHFY